MITFEPFGAAVSGTDLQDLQINKADIKTSVTNPFCDNNGSINIPRHKRDGLARRWWFCHAPLWPHGHLQFRGVCLLVDGTSRAYANVAAIQPNNDPTAAMTLPSSIPFPLRGVLVVYWWRFDNEPRFHWSLWPNNCRPVDHRRQWIAV